MIAQETTRCCIRCGIVWPIENFRQDAQNAKYGWRRRECKVCHREKMAEWRAKNREQYREYRRKLNADSPSRPRILAERRKSSKIARERARFTVLQHYGSKCNCCGETEICFLSVDHINNDGAAHRRTMNHSNQWLWLIRNDFPEGFQILCMNCNFGKRINGGTCPHVA